MMFNVDLLLCMTKQIDIGERMRFVRGRMSPLIYHFIAFNLSRINILNDLPLLPIERKQKV
jgi:hypothetical protein